MRGGSIFGGLDASAAASHFTPTIPTLVDLSSPMQRTRGRVSRPPRHQPPAKTPQAASVGVHGYDVLAAEFGVRPSSRLAASAARSPDASRVAVHHSPRLSAAAAASVKGSNLASSPRESDDGGDSVTASQVLLSPPPPRTVSYVCDWAQAIRCEYPTLKPLPCQRDGCQNTRLVHHLCQSAWERREGYDDTVARYCCLHHPDYKYRGAPPKEDASVARAQDVLSKARVVNVESQLTTVGIDVLLSDGVGGSADDNGSRGDNSEDSESVGDVAGGKEVGGGAAYVELPPFQITDYTADTYDVHERTAHFMERRPISAVNRTAVEAVYMVEALTMVRSMKTMRKPEIAAKLQAKYKELIQSIPLERFSDMTLKMMMETKYYRAKGTSADGLLTKANEVLKNVRVMAAGIQGIGTPLHQIPSGRSLTDMRNQFILSKWSEANGTVYVPSNDDENLIAEVADGWWLLSPNTHLLLAVLVHRSNPDIIADPTTVPTGTTREILRKDSQHSLRERREKDKIVELHTMGRQKTEELMLKTKAELMAQSVDSGTIEQVKEQLSLLSQFKDSFVKVRNGIDGKGEEEFDNNVNDLLGELPFMKKRRTMICDGPSSEVSNLGDTPTTKTSN